MNIESLLETHHPTSCRYCCLLFVENITLFHISRRLSKFSFTQIIRSAVVTKYLNFVSRTCFRNGFNTLQDKAKANFLRQFFHFFFVHIIVNYVWDGSEHFFREVWNTSFARKRCGRYPKHLKERLRQLENKVESRD